LLVGENWLKALVSVGVMDVQTSIQEILFHLLNIFALTDPHFDFSIASANILDGIIVNSSFNDMFGLSDLSNMR
jgi:hypothetical protein